MKTYILETEDLLNEWILSSSSVGSLKRICLGIGEDQVGNSWPSTRLGVSSLLLVSLANIVGESLADEFFPFGVPFQGDCK